MRLYDQAINSAVDNRFAHQEALAAELASRFYRARGFDLIAAAYLRRARDRYAAWGAHGKVRQLDQQQPCLAETSPLAPTAILSARAEQFDVLSVVKASQAISRQIVLPQLQETLIRLVLEHAGAQHGCLLLGDDEGLTIHALAELEGDRTRVDILPAAAVSSDAVPTTLLNYVARTGEAVVLADAAADARYCGDEYITVHKPRSVLGMPITRQGRLIGILYLENNLAAGAFIPSKLAVLELLTAQAAISLETARLYAERGQAEETGSPAQLAFRALHDDLTGLPNRALLLDHLRAALARAHRDKTAVGVLFIDLDEFKSVNDTFGHIAADGFLVQVGQRISASLRETDIAARVGGDEFVVVCERLTDPRRCRGGGATDPVALSRIFRSMAAGSGHQPVSGSRSAPRAARSRTCCGKLTRRCIR